MEASMDTQIRDSGISSPSMVATENRTWIRRNKVKINLAGWPLVGATLDRITRGAFTVFIISGSDFVTPLPKCSASNRCQMRDMSLFSILIWRLPRSFQHRTMIFLPPQSLWALNLSQSKDRPVAQTGKPWIVILQTIVTMRSCQFVSLQLGKHLIYAQRDLISSLQNWKLSR